MSLDNLLQIPGVTLEMILNENILYELQSQEFAQFVLQNQQLDRMLYLLNADNSCSREEQIRYPFMISEILSVNELIVDYFEASHYFYLFEMFDKDTLNLTQAGYFAKVALSLVRKRGAEVWDCLTANMNYLNDLIKHLDVFHIATVIEQLLQYQQHPYQQQLVQRIVSYMVAKSYSPEVVDNCCFILNEVMINDTQLRYIEATCLPEKFFTVAVKSLSPKPIQLIITLIDLIQKYIQTREPEYKFNYFQFLGLAADFATILGNTERYNRFQSTYGTEQKTLTQFKIRLLDLYLAILRINDATLTNTFDHQQIFQLMMQYLIQHEFNNALQILFFDITTLIFLNQEYLYIQQALYYNVKIQDFIVKNNHTQKESCGMLTKPIMKGYCGVLNKLSYFFNHMFPDQEWAEYLQRLESIKQTECSFILGVNPREGATPQQEQIQQNPNQEEQVNENQEQPNRDQQPPVQEEIIAQDAIEVQQ